MTTINKLILDMKCLNVDSSHIKTAKQTFSSTRDPIFSFIIFTPSSLSDSPSFSMGRRSGLKMGEDEADAPREVSGEEHLGDGDDEGELIGKGDDLLPEVLR